MAVRLPEKSGVCHDRAVTHCGMDLGPAVQLSHMEPAGRAHGSGRGWWLLGRGELGLTQVYRA